MSYMTIFSMRYKDKYGKELEKESLELQTIYKTGYIDAIEIFQNQLNLIMEDVQNSPTYTIEENDNDEL
jgi:hypothetical protein